MTRHSKRALLCGVAGAFGGWLTLAGGSGYVGDFEDEDLGMRLMLYFPIGIVVVGAVGSLAGAFVFPSRSQPPK